MRSCEVWRRQQRWAPSAIRAPCQAAGSGGASVIRTGCCTHQWLASVASCTIEMLFTSTSLIGRCLPPSHDTCIARIVVTQAPTCGSSAHLWLKRPLVSTVDHLAIQTFSMAPSLLCKNVASGLCTSVNAVRHLVT